MRSRHIFILLSLSLLASCDSDYSSIQQSKSIILFMGDGLGAEQRKAARWFAYGQGSELRMDSLTYHGNARTSSNNRIITDSSAAATAIATGTKINNGIIGMDASLNSLTTILEIAKAKGLSTGLVTNTQISHATPASFAAHVENRRQVLEIALQLIGAEIDVLLGGGEDDFIPLSVAGKHPEPGNRTDGRNLITEAIDNGYPYVSNSTELRDVNIASVNRLLGLFSDEGMTRPFSPSLTEMTEVAIRILGRNPKGFFLMVEAGQIDWAGHANDALNVMQDTADLDKAVSLAIDYVKNQQNVLLVVTADHETGGMSSSLVSAGLPDEVGPFMMPNQTPFYVNWSTMGHTSLGVPVTSSGAMAENLTGNFENTFLFVVMNLHLQ